MLQEPMMEKLTAMRLLGIVEALKTQEQDPASRELSFLERLGLLVDHQWTWRQNQALARRLHSAKLKGGACVASDVLGKSGRAMLNAMVEGKEDPEQSGRISARNFAFEDPTTYGSTPWADPAGTSTPVEATIGSH